MVTASPPRAGEQKSPRRHLKQWPTALVLLAVVVSLVVATGEFRAGSVLLGGSAILAMFLRLFLQEEEAGLLAVRTKAIDVATLAVLGVGLALLAFLVPLPAT